MKIFLITTLITSALFFNIFIVKAEDIMQRLSGWLLLQTEEQGQVWYVNPANQIKYSLGNPSQALQAFRELGIGITNENLNKIPVGLDFLVGEDFDGDGLPNRLEWALGTDEYKLDTDGDGYNDKLEIQNNYSPVFKNQKLPINNYFVNIHAGKIFLQVENKGEAWYINPRDGKRYFLGMPDDALSVMRNLSLGITNNNLAKISTGYLSTQTIAKTIPTFRRSNFPPPETTDDDSNTSSNTSSTNTSNSNNQPSDPISNNSASSAISNVADAIRQGNNRTALSYFTDDMQNAVSYSLNFLDDEGKLALGNILSDATLSDSNSNQATYSTTIYFSGYTTELDFIIKKQPDGGWLLSNL